MRYLVLHGSHAYGLATESSDLDYRGVFQLPNDDFLGLGSPLRTWEDTGSDAVAWELGHFIHLLLKGNPNLMEMLWMPDDEVLVTSPVVETLRAKRHAFMSTAMARAYVGWMYSEAKQALSAKRASHLARLSIAFHIAVESGELPVRVPSAYLDYVMSLKEGRVWLDLDAVLKRAAEDEEHAFLHWPEPPRDLANRILLEARHRV